MSSWAETVRSVEARARRRCEYCRMHQALQGATFHVEHVVPISQHGKTELDNLAFACPSCNLHKSDRTRTFDPETGLDVLLFNPRLDSWDEHFRLEDHHLVGLTPVGRGTIALLDLNHPRRILIRQAEELFELGSAANYMAAT